MNYTFINMELRST